MRVAYPWRRLRDERAAIMYRTICALVVVIVLALGTTAAAVRSLRVQSIRGFRRTVVTRGALRGELVLVQEAAESVASANLSVAGWRLGRDRFEDRRSLLERAVRPVCVVCAGINRHGEGEEGALHRRSSDPRWPRVMRWRS